jgi:proteasome lid subunit RPN8/RPN11
MEDFQVQESLSNLLPEIYSHMAKEAPREGCGLVIDGPKFIPLLYVVHSHYMQDCKPSEHDKNNCKAIGIPYLIVSYPEKKEYIYDPS